MTRRVPPLGVFALALLAGCAPAGERPGSQATGPSPQQIATGQAVAREAAEQRLNLVFAQRAEFVTAMRGQLSALNRNLIGLSEQVAQAGDAIQVEANPQLVELRNQATQLRRQLGEVTNATPASWSVIKAGIEKDCAALQAGLAQLHQRLGDPPAL